MDAILRAPFGRRAWAEVLYILVSVPLAALGSVYALAVLGLGVGLAVTAVGIPLLASGLYGARRVTAVHRGLVRRLLGEALEAPAEPRVRTGFLGRVQGRLSDGAGWRALVYLLFRPLLALLYVYVLLLTWAWSVLGITYPVQWAMGLNRDLTVGAFAFDTWPRSLLLCAAGVVLFFVSPWAVHLTVMLDRLLTRWLLGRRGLAERVRDLEATRAQAVDDAAATLRRIERDLHDGAQVRLIALTMQLTMVRDAVSDDATRSLVASAQATAREAVEELRELVRGIHPPALDHGLETALSTLAARSAVPVSLEVSLTTRPTAAIESIAYFCAAELLANVAKHSGASQAWLSLAQASSRLRLCVRDDGSGGAVLGAGSGLPGLLDRVRTVDGRLDISSPSGGPTVVTVDLPSHA